MTPDEELICRTWNRDVFVAWKNGEITFDEASYFARRVEFHDRIDWMPEMIVMQLLRLWDFFHEPIHGEAEDEAS